ncbi:hypothetical protein GCM10022294_07920 [Dietzia aurantiaca]
MVDVTPLRVRLADEESAQAQVATDLPHMRPTVEGAAPAPSRQEPGPLSCTARSVAGSDSIQRKERSAHAFSGNVSGTLFAMAGRTLPAALGIS